MLLEHTTKGLIINIVPNVAQLNIYVTLSLLYHCQMPSIIQLEHNLRPKRFKWLWAKYVTGVNPKHHCTNCLTGAYSKKLSKHNPNLEITRVLHLNEVATFKAIYLCGVVQKGYPKDNYPHNLHVAIIPRGGASEFLQFEDWEFRLVNGVFCKIPPTSCLSSAYADLPPEYTSCRIFRWAVVAGSKL